MKKRLLISGLLALSAFLLISAGSVNATPGDPHQVWVCKYVGQPGDFETLKDGKNPIIVDVAAADAYVGADFADGQTHSLVIDIATDANTGQGERYTGEATCPTKTVESPAPSLTAAPSATSTVTPSDSPEPTVNPTLEPTPSMEPTVNPTESPSPETTLTPSVSMPPTDTDATVATTVASPVTLLILVLAGLALVLAFSAKKFR